MNRGSCFFIGHRDTPTEIYPALYAAIEDHIVNYGVRNFFVGRYGSFDRLATSAVKAAKRIYPDVKLTLLLPYHPAEKSILADILDALFCLSCTGHFQHELPLFVVFGKQLFSFCPGASADVIGKFLEVIA